MRSPNGFHAAGAFGALCTLLPAAPPALKPDTYHVEWVAVACDGHCTEGDYGFTVAPAC